ncbi:MAG: cyclin-like protein [Piptocephalis tieghemiana]|nr:MAG: cyclin-like protein [Piptocephalis tieghemiana]
MPCVECGGTILQNEAEGNSYCSKCGLVLEENTIVSEVSFGEKSNGAAVLQGTYVGAGSLGVGFTGPNRRFHGTEGKQQAMKNGKQRIQALAVALRIPEIYIESASRYFNLALAQNFTRGRRTVHVAAVCLYIACRMERTSHMLIDFSDLLQLNVFVLGATFLTLVKLLGLQLPLVDPSIYIHRFAAALEFGDKTQAVASDALRLVRRMSIDWIQTGRRPSGICGACLLIAARMHDFRRTKQEVIRVVKIGDATLQRRLNEFEKTPSSAMTVSDFQSVWLEESCDPPAFTRAKTTAKDDAAFLAEFDRTYREQTLIRSARAREKLELSRKRKRTLLSSNAQEKGMSEEDLPMGHAKLMKESPQGMEGEDADKRKEDENREGGGAEEEEEEFLWSDLDDAEILGIIMEEDEIKVKTERWEAENGEFMRERERKALQAQSMGLQYGGAGGRAKKAKQRRRREAERQAGLTRDMAPSMTAAAIQILSQQKQSSKVNYEKLREVLAEDPDEPGTESPPLVKDTKDDPRTGVDEDNLELVEEPGDPRHALNQTTDRKSADHGDESVNDGTKSKVTDAGADEEEEEDAEEEEEEEVFVDDYEGHGSDEEGYGYYDD